MLGTLGLLPSTARGSGVTVALIDSGLFPTAAFGVRIKAFYGTSQNAVKAQIWIAVSVYLLVAIMKKRLGIPLPLYTILQILSVSIFEKTALVELFSQTNYKTPEPYSPNQLSLFD